MVTQVYIEEAYSALNKLDNKVEQAVENHSSGSQSVKARSGVPKEELDAIVMGLLAIEP